MAGEEQLSQEEIQKRIEMMKENCIFCKIIKEEIPGKVVFEDDLCTAILDINPATNGHLLLMPKEHYMMMPMVPDEVLGHLSVISKYLSDLLQEAFSAQDVTVYMANGGAAGQQVQHFMMHIIPRYSGDGLNFDVQGDSLSDSELEKLANSLKQKLQQMSQQSGK
ncbi:MAG: HIT domain-containing protein [Nanoarchaeota archaeon]|nr:HIT domain-containing protein [Nanoarchaeota archaeon]